MRAYLITSIVLLLTCHLAGDEPSTSRSPAEREADNWSETPHWLDRWKIDPKATFLLGFSLGEDDDQPPEKLHFGFFPSRDVAAQAMGEEYLRSQEQYLAKRVKQKVVAAGGWKEKTSGHESLFVVTQKNGTTYLWFGDVTKSLNVAEVHFVRGTRRDRDLLILDYNVPSVRLDNEFGRRLTSAAYRRDPNPARQP